MEKTNETKNRFSEKINEIDKPLARPKKKEERMRVTDTRRDERRAVPAGRSRIHRALAGPWEQLHTAGNLGGSDQLILNNTPSEGAQGAVNNLRSPVIIIEIEFIVEKLLKKEICRPVHSEF